MAVNAIIRNKKGRWLFAGILVLIIIGVAIGLTFYLISDVAKTRKGSVVTNGYHCAEIGKTIFEKGGNVADVAIAAALCEGVVNPQSMGLGGGFLLTIYTKATGEVWSLNSREVAPAAATTDMYHSNDTLAKIGGLAVAVPSELVGYWYLYERFGGNLAWKDLIQPTIDLCYNGIYVNGYLANILQNNEDVLRNDEVLSAAFIDPSTDKPYVEGQYVKRSTLAKTLEVIAEEGGYALHNGSLTEGFVQDIRDNGGIITADELRNYRPKWQQPVNVTLSGGESIYSAPLPGSGPIVAFILNLLDSFVDTSDPNSVTTYQRIVEAFKFAYGSRTQLGDPDFIEISELVANLTSGTYAEYIRQFIFDNQTSQDPLYYGANMTLAEDYGTAHISILAPNGDAVAITSTINYVFGAKFASTSTGIILNNEMDDFSSPNITSGYAMSPSPANYIVGGKQPLSSMCPTIILDENGDVIMVTGAAGGTKITTTVSLLIMKHLWFGVDLQSTMDDKRLHHQLFPMSITFEGPYATEDLHIVEGLSNIGHNYTIQTTDGFAAATSISRNRATDQVTGVSDKRRPGTVSDRKSVV